MPRVKLVERSSYEHSYTLDVRTTDLNYAGHLGNEALLGLVHEARARFMQKLNLNTIISPGQSTGLIIADLVVNFKAEAFAHELLTIDSQIGELGSRSFRLFHRLHNELKLVALVETGLVAWSYDASQAVKLPAIFLSSLQEHRKNLTDATYELEKRG